MAAAEDDEVVGIGDDVGTKGRRLLLETPELQEPVDVQVGEKRRDDTASVRRTASP